MCIFVYPLGGYFKGIFESNQRVGFGYFFHHDGSVIWSDFKDSEPVCIKGIADKEVEQEEVEERIEPAITLVCKIKMHHVQKKMHPLFWGIQKSSK